MKGHDFKKKKFIYILMDRMEFAVNYALNLHEKY